ncbi:MAG: c-type cytochrome domain-containing protein [Candidatus Promineifilaceae bacterium]|nr:c-type cytochrome domain-containing protein [Candidatus Promineifilaceae bacterium]
MRRLWQAFKRFVFPPAGSPLWIRMLPFAIAGVLTLIVIYSSVQAWTYTNSSEFCGMTCHTMPPEYSAYQRSPHARVQCVECHIGRDVVTTQFTRKAGDLRHVLLTITKDYEFPIHSRAMRPARDSCEKCHFPEKFSDDSLREIRHYEGENNDPQSTYLVMKTGGGTEREGLGRGIHWHIENEVYFLPTDVLQQEIPYVRAVDDEGNITEYYDIASDMTPEEVAGSTLERMDCITCHNRVTHNIPNPDTALDQALYRGLLPNDLPDIQRQSMDLLSKPYPNSDEAIAGIQSLPEFYAENYPEVFAERQDEIQQAVVLLLEIYNQLVFHDQQLDWNTHPDNLGHTNFPGCFRCHDGKHLSGDEQAIRLECNLCHSIPVVADESTLTTNLEIGEGPEPPSHTHTSWITLHGKAIDSSCAACHEPGPTLEEFESLEGKPPADGSFCGNVACHANEWTYTGFDSPELEPVLARQIYILQNTSPYLLEGVPLTYEGTFAAMLNGRCAACHSGVNAEGGLDLSSYESAFAGGNSGPVIVPGDPEASLLIQRQSESRDHFGQVLGDELEALRVWIANGAPQS